MRRVLILCVASVLPIMAQRTTPGSQGSPRVPIVRFPSLASDPATCTVGSAYFNSATSTVRQCYAANTWGDVAVSIRNYGCAVGDPAGSALSTGVLCYVTVPKACTIVAWDILVDSGTATVDVWKVATGTAIPTDANSITASAQPAIASGTAIHSSTLTGWTTSVAANDILGFNLDATSGPKYLSATIQCQE